MPIKAFAKIATPRGLGCRLQPGYQVTDSGGSAVYDPGLLFQSLGAGQTATDTFTYTLKDSFGLTMTVTVTGVNDAPLAHADGVLYVEGSGDLAIHIADLLRNDFDPDAGDSLSFSSVSATADSSGASLTLTTTSSFTTPATSSTASRSASKAAMPSATRSKTPTAPPAASRSP